MVDTRTNRRISREVITELRNEASTLRADAKSETNSREDRIEATGLCLEILVALEEAGEEVDFSLDAEFARESVELLDGDGLVALADEVDTSIEEVLDNRLDEEYLENLAERIEWALQQRARFAHRIAGATRILGCAPESFVEQHTAGVYFDSCIRPNVWALSFLNEQREGHVMMIEPGRRSKAWWWSEAVDLPWKAIEHAHEVAELLERYPSFGTFFEKLRKNAHQWTVSPFSQSLQETAKSTEEIESEFSVDVSGSRGSEFYRDFLHLGPTSGSSLEASLGETRLILEDGKDDRLGSASYTSLNSTEADKTQELRSSKHEKDLPPSKPSQYSTDDVEESSRVTGQTDDES